MNGMGRGVINFTIIISLLLLFFSQFSRPS
jgi:hypothetical protein